MFFTTILKYVVVSIVICLLYGIQVFSASMIKKISNDKFKGSYLFQFWGLVLAIILWKLYPEKIFIFNTHNVWKLKNIVLILICVIPTSIIAYHGKKDKPKKTFNIENFLNGASMEIPQRLLVQNLFVVLGIDGAIYGPVTLAILLNAIIWVQFIIIQEIMEGKKVSFNIIPEITASFWFSIWVGIIYGITGNIVVAMLTHGLQRFCTYSVLGKLQTNKSS
ncbi:hypothetical protein R9X47_22970 [Wukongibacter baidiensis]|uniref:hypothetical protein n=1 Tax=Wukongibacter baidiensis TaxID=1723361 RepID=UPI003D7F1AC1